MGTIKRVAMSDSEFLSFGSRVKKIRKHFYLSQREFADRLELSGGFLSDVEAGKTLAGHKFLKNILKNVIFYLPDTGTGTDAISIYGYIL